MENMNAEGKNVIKKGDLPPWFKTGEDHPFLIQKNLAEEPMRDRNS